MAEKLKEKYGLPMAICMVIGVVIGSGVFFKAQNVLNATNGDMPLGIIAWLIGGFVMLICGYNFATLATYYSKTNGLVDYGEELVGKNYAYYLGWFSVTVYCPGMTSALAWVSARFTLAIFVPDGEYTMTSATCLALAGFYLCASYFINAIAPKLAGKLQVSMTVIKLIPIFIMAIVGTIIGIKNGTTMDAFNTFGASSSVEGGTAQALLKSVVAVAFAYEGWIVATSINSELKDAKKNLPKAFIFGCSAIVAIYILYYIGIAGGASSVDVLRNEGATSVFNTLFGKAGGTFFGICIAISCLGTLNGLMVASTRGMYAIGTRNMGPLPKGFSEVSEATNMPTNSSVFGLFICALWLFYFYAANLSELASIKGFDLFCFDSSELPIITVYAFYIPIFINFIRKHGKENIFKNTVMPVFGVIACLFFVFAALYSHGYTPMMTAKAEGSFKCPVLFYLIVFAVFMIIGAILKNPKKKSK